MLYETLKPHQQVLYLLRHQKELNESWVQSKVGSMDNDKKTSYIQSYIQSYITSPNEPNRASLNKLGLFVNGLSITNNALKKVQANIEAIPPESHHRTTKSHVLELLKAKSVLKNRRGTKRKISNLHIELIMQVTK